MTESSHQIDDVDEVMDDLDPEVLQPTGFKQKLGEFSLRVFGTLHDWWISRRWIRFIESLPAVLVGSLILAPVVISGNASESNLGSRYRAEVERAIQSNNYEAAEIYLQKLIQLNVMDDDVRYAVAFVAEHQGDEKRAKTILTELASTSDGHPRAHLWMAKQLASGKRILSSDDREKLIHHLQCALKSTSPPVDANIMLGQLYTQTKEYKKAIKHFEAVTQHRPEIHLTLGQLYLKENEKSRAKIELTQAADYFRRRIDSAPNDNDARIALALSLRLQNEMARAKEVILSGLQGDPKNSDLRNIFAAFCIDQFDSIASPEEGNFEDQLELLETALAYAPENAQALDRLASFCSIAGSAGDRARTKLKEVLASGKATATIHLILATQAVSQGDSATARLHFEQGFQLNPRLPILLNNYAWLLSHQDKPDLDRALRLINQAVEITPLDSNIRETRGQIYVKLKRWRDALVDLEFALPKLSKSRELHASLASVYRELGEPEIAAEHRRLAEGK